MSQINQDIAGSRKVNATENLTLEIETMELLSRMCNEAASKLLYIYLPSNTVGGYEQLFANIASYLSSNGYKIVFLDSNGFMKNSYFTEDSSIIFY